MSVARGRKVRWALIGSGVLWAVPFLLTCYIGMGSASGAPNPMGSNAQIGMALGLFAIAGFLVTAFVLWLVSFVIDTVRHRAP